MQTRDLRPVVPILLTAIMLTGGWLLTASAPAAAQCLPRSECAALKEEVRELRREIRPKKRELRELGRQIRELPQGSPERQELREQARALKREIGELRREARPVIRRFRQGCRNC